MLFVVAERSAFVDQRKNHLKNPELLKRALLYTKPFGGKIICYCEDTTVANGGMVNEGEIAATLGMKVRPALAEELAITRDLYIAEYTNSPIHITGVSSKKSVEIIEIEYLLEPDYGIQTLFSDL